MKREELMIGDWVSVIGTPMRIAEHGTVRAGLLDEKGEMSYNSYAIIEPIPLTVNILYKNGFDCDEDGFISYNEFAINFGRDPFEEGPNLLFVWVGNSRVELQYVHEIQHALRLCGIEKEIKLC